MRYGVGCGSKASWFDQTRVAAGVAPGPYRAFFLSAAIAVAAMWAGLTISYTAAKIPPSFAIIAVITAAYAVGLVATRRGHAPMFPRSVNENEPDTIPT